MSEKIQIAIRAIVPNDAGQLLTIQKQLAKETDYLVMDALGMGLSTDDLSTHLERINGSSVDLLLGAFLEEKLVAIASVHTKKEVRLSHISEVGIAVLEEFWGLGLGSILMEELLDFVRQTPEIRRLELTVQKRNQRAIHLYEKFGFLSEAVMPRGAVDEEGQFLDVYLMSKLID